MLAKKARRVVFQPGVHLGIQRGIDQMVGAIRPTLGPLPRSVLMDSLDFGSQAPDLLDDGGSIARRIIQLADRDADVGAMFLREVLWRLQSEVGDGTATAAVLFQSVYEQGIRFLASGGSAQSLHKYLEQGLQDILDELFRMTAPVTGKEMLAKVALSSCSDPQMAKYLGEVFDVVGEYGRVEIRGGRARDLRREYVEGMYWDWGVHYRDNLAGCEGLRADLENPAILITDMEIDDPYELFPVIALAIDAGYPALLIIAKGLSKKVIGFLQTNKKPEKIQVLAVKTPGWDKEETAAALADLAVLTGGQSFVQVAGDRLAYIKPGQLGRARRAWVEQENFGIVGGRGDPRALRRHIAALRAAFARTEDVNRRNKLRERIGKLLGGSATLWIGGLTEREIESRTELAERAAASVRGAMLDGILPGGGIGLFSCRPLLEQRMKQSCVLEERAAYHILFNAVAEPFRTIMMNAGYEPGEVMARIQRAGPGCGLDVHSGEIVPMLEAGVSDPAYVQKSAVYTAISSAALALTVDTVVHKAKPEKADLPKPAKRKNFNAGETKK